MIPILKMGKWHGLRNIKFIRILSPISNNLERVVVLQLQSVNMIFFIRCSQGFGRTKSV